MSHSIRETTMNVFDPRSIYIRKSSTVPCPSEGFVRKKLSAAFCSDPATAMPRRIGSAANTTGRRDSPRIAPLYRRMIFRRAMKTVHVTSRDARGPGLASPKPRATVSAATARGLRLPQDAGVHAQRATRLRDEDIFEGDLLRPDELDRGTVPCDRRDDVW